MSGRRSTTLAIASSPLRATAHVEPEESQSGGQDVGDVVLVVDHQDVDGRVTVTKQVHRLSIWPHEPVNHLRPRCEQGEMGG